MKSTCRFKIFIPGPPIDFILIFTILSKESQKSWASHLKLKPVSWTFGFGGKPAGASRRGPRAYPDVGILVVLGEVQHVVQR